MISAGPTSLLTWLLYALTGVQKYVYESTSYQDQWTNVFLEEGVDVVLGTHPHVIEPVKEFTRESDGHKMVVYYSLGNFVSNQDEIPRMIGGMAKLTL